MKLNKKNLKFIFLIILIIAIILLVKIYNLQNYISADIFRNKINSYGIFAPLIYIVIYIAATILLIPGSVLTIAGGVIFGVYSGTLYTLIGATIGATLAFIFSRYLGREFVKDLFEKKFKKLNNYDKKLEKNGFLAVLFLRIIPLFPFNGLNYALGLTEAKIKDYVMATAIGIIPGTFVYTFLGNSIIQMNTINIIISIILVFLLALILPIYKYYKKKK